LKLAVVAGTLLLSACTSAPTPVDSLAAAVAVVHDPTFDAKPCRYVTRSDRRLSNCRRGLDSLRADTEQELRRHALRFGANLIWIVERPVAPPVCLDLEAHFFYCPTELLPESATSGGA